MLAVPQFHSQHTVTLWPWERKCLTQFPQGKVAIIIIFWDLCQINLFIFSPSFPENPSYPQQQELGNLFIVPNNTELELCKCRSRDLPRHWCAAVSLVPVRCGCVVVTNARAGHKLDGQAPREGTMSYLEQQEAESQALSSGRERASMDWGRLGTSLWETPTCYFKDLANW